MVGKVFNSGFMSGLNDIGSEFVKQSGSYNQASFSENTPRSLDVPNPNNPDEVLDFGLLGDFASKIDQTAQRSYVESGYISNIKPRFLDVLFQEPDITVVIKKRMFSSLADNYRIDFMDSAERNFIRASKRLFQNKCQAISAYERLTKIDKVIKNKGLFDDFLMPLIVSGIETLDSLGVKNIVSPETRGIIDKIRRLQAFSEPESFTTWFVDPDTAFDMGEGTGTFSLTTLASIDTSAGIRLGSGGCNLKIEDPYHLMNISNLDIDRAIADTYNPKQSSSLFQFSEQEITKQNQSLKTELSTERMQRGATNIIWQVNDDSILNKRIRAYIDEEGREIIFNFDPGVGGIGATVELDDSASEGENGLTSSEASKFKKITTNTYLILNLRRQREKELTDLMYDDNKAEIEYIRSKMRLQFANKHMIQNMDSVHVFISSKTTKDSKASGVDLTTIAGTSSNLLNMLNSKVDQVEQGLNDILSLFGNGNYGKTFTDIEKDAIVGPDFPSWLWGILRNSFTRQAAGTHVCAGIVGSVTESYSSSDGRYTLSVSCKDNSEYFKKGQINVKPASDVPERSIFDPLTPFDLEFDASTGFLINDHPKLLTENERILNTGIVKFKNGSKFIGSSMTQFLYLIGSNDIKQANEYNKVQRVFFDPDGFVYRWKSGIGTFTYNGSKHPRNNIRQETSPALTKNPFAGQDIMNVLSLLITGQPYNYNNFISSAMNFSFEDTKKNDALTNTEISRTFYRSLISDLNIENQVWGNFIPFKKIIMDESAMKFMIQGQFSVQRANAQMSSLLRERARLFDTMAAAESTYADNPNINQLNINGVYETTTIGNSTALSIPVPGENQIVVNQALDQLYELDTKIANQQNQISQALSESNLNDGSLQIFGNDLSFSPDMEGWGNQVGEESREEQRAQLRKKMKYLTQRRLWKVKSNDDQNYMIVDDQYDKDYDIQAFEKALAGRMELLKSSYQDVFSQVSSVSSILGLEVFANTQGHIEVRPPCYNKMPKSVFARMVADKKRVYPKALEELFINQAEGLVDRLKIVEDEIRLRTIALGFDNDTDASKFISSARMQRSGAYVFKFITDEYNGEFGGKPYTIRALIKQDSPDTKESEEYKALKSVTAQVTGQTRQQFLFDSSAQLKAIYDSKNYLRPATESVYSVYERVQRRLELNKGQKVQSLTELVSGTMVRNTSSDPNSPVRQHLRTQTDTLKLTNEISLYISERQSVLKNLRNSFRNLDEGALLNNDDSQRRNILFPNLQKSTIPTVIQHLIEDEEEDDLGEGSGGRYIIRDNQIISMNIEENEPEFTTTEVNGVLGEGFVSPVGENSLGYGGNLQTSAIAVDYDLWRMYGFKKGETVQAAYISDSDSQAAPLAVWLLTEQRRKLISGSLTIIGNEFMQPGEVIYIEDRDLLFYVESVSHNFSFGSSFTTSLKLSFGHNPGEYFPTMLDVVGKGLYSKKNSANKIRHARHGNSSGDQNIGALITDAPNTINYGFSTDIVESLVKGRYGDHNRGVLTQLLMALKGSDTPGTDEEAFVEIRYYYNEKKGFAPSNNLANLGTAVKTWLKHPTKKIFGGSDKGSQLPDNKLDTVKASEIDRLVSVRSVGLTDPVGPSPDAWLAARETRSSGIDIFGTYGDITNGSPIKTTGNNGVASSIAEISKLQSSALVEEKALYATVLDVWITFKKKDTTLEESSLTDQASQEINATIGSL